MTVAAADPPSASFGEHEAQAADADGDGQDGQHLAAGDAFVRQPLAGDQQNEQAHGEGRLDDGEGREAQRGGLEHPPQITHSVPSTQRLRETRFFSSESLSDSVSGTSRASSDWSSTPTLYELAAASATPIPSR